MRQYLMSAIAACCACTVGAMVTSGWSGTTQPVLRSAPTSCRVRWCLLELPRLLGSYVLRWPLEHALGTMLCTEALTQLQ